MKKLIGAYILNDPEKLIVVFETAKEVGNPFIENHTVGSIIYLLRKNGIQFNYVMQFLPLPTSAELTDDIIGLEQAGFLISKESIGITEMGSQWVKNTGQEALELLKKISKPLSEYLQFNEKQLFDMIYSDLLK